MRIPLVILLIAVSAAVALSQSGRRGSTPATTPVAPIQPPLHPQPEPAAAPSRPTRPDLLYLPEGLLERKIKAFDNSTFRIADFNGKVVVINLWASWCGPCRMEVPEYERVRKAYANREVEFIALTAEDPRTASDKVKQFVRDVNFGFRLGWAEREDARTLMNGRGAIPQTIVIAADGRIINHWTGYARGASGDRLRQAIEEGLRGLH